VLALLAALALLVLALVRPLAALLLPGLLLTATLALLVLPLLILLVLAVRVVLVLVCHLEVLPVPAPPKQFATGKGVPEMMFSFNFFPRLSASRKQPPKS